MATTEAPEQIVTRVRDAATRNPGEYPDLSGVSDERIIQIATRPAAPVTLWGIAQAAFEPDPEILVHPADLLEERAEQMTRSISATVPERMATSAAARALRNHEENNAVTFLAVKNADLAAARALVDAGLRGAATRQDPQACALYDALATLLGEH